MKILLVNCLLVLVLATLVSSQPAKPRRIRIIIIRVRRPAIRGRRDLADVTLPNLENSPDIKDSDNDLIGSHLNIGDIIEGDLVDGDGDIKDGDTVYGDVIEGGDYKGNGDKLSDDGDLTIIIRRKKKN